MKDLDNSRTIRKGKKVEEIDVMPTNNVESDSNLEEENNSKQSDALDLDDYSILGKYISGKKP